jgi:hypothetical protein
MEMPAWRPDIFERMELAVQKVDERMRRAMDALTGASIIAAVIGAKAVAYWVGLKDEGLVRNTPNVDLLIDPSDAEGSRTALEKVGFVYVAGSACPMAFLDGPEGRERSAVRLWFVGDVVRPGVEPFPDLTRTIPTWPYRVPALPTLLRMKLSSYRTIDQVHVQDMIATGLIDETCLGAVPVELRDRLQILLADPDG